MEKEAKKEWNEKLNETKILIKRLVRENLTSSVNPNIEDQLHKEMDRLGLNPDNVGKITINGKEVNLGTDEGLKKSAQRMALACTLVAGVLSCGKEDNSFSFNSTVSGVEYKTNNNQNDDSDIDTINVTNNQGNQVDYRVDSKGEKIFGRASHGVNTAKPTTPEEEFIYAFGQSKKEEIRSNRAMSKSISGEKVFDFKPDKAERGPSINYGKPEFERIQDTHLFKYAIELLQNPRTQKEFNEEAISRGLPNLKASDVISGKYN